MSELFIARAEERRRSLAVLRRRLHARPELAFQETKTAGLVAERMRCAGLDVRVGVAGTGVVAVLRGSRPGRVVLVRADMDALPITEKNNVLYRSRNRGVMHACGHDGHVAVAVVLAELLAAQRADLAGTMVFAFQPAEEIAGGALPMIEAGTLDEPPVDFVIGFHVWNDLPVGTIAVRPGPAFASMDEVVITVEGRAGHGGTPHQATDPIVVAAHILSALQTIVSRETSPLEAAVVTIGTIQGGSAPNVIPEKVEMRGTVRAFAEGVREKTIRRVGEIVTTVAAAFRSRATVATRACCPPVVNNPGVTEVVHEAASRIMGAEGVLEMEQTMGSDDVAYFLERVPGCYFVVGSRNPERGLDGEHHSPYFDFDEAALANATKVLGMTALRLLESSSAKGTS